MLGVAIYIGLCVILMIIILRKLLIKSRSNNNPSFEYKFYKNVTIISIAAFALAGINDVIDVTYYFINGIDVIETNLVWLITTTNIFYACSVVSLYMIVFGKLYFTLQESATHKLHKAIVIYIMALIILIGILIVIYALCFLSLYRDERNAFYVMLEVFFWIIAVSDFILTTSVVTIFVYKLFQIIKDIGQHRLTTLRGNTYYQAGYDKDDTNTDNDDLKEDMVMDNEHQDMLGYLNLTEDQTKLLKIITRHCILCTIAIISNTIFYASVLYCSREENKSEQQLCFTVYSNAIKSTQGVVNATALYLNFAFNDAIYRKWCCCCHVLCYKAVQRVFRRIYL